MKDEQYYDTIKNNSSLRNSSKEEHVRNLKKAKQIFENKSIDEIIKEPKQFKKRLEEQDLSIASKSNVVGAILSIFRSSSVIRENNKDLFNIWKDLYDDIKQPLRDKYERGEMSEKQKKAYVSFDEVCSKRDKLEEGSQVRLLLSLFTLMPAKRAQEFHNMVVLKKEPRRGYNNYLVINNKYAKMVINEYKTSDKYGTIVEYLSKQLKNEILASLNKNPRKYLFVKENGKPFADRKSFDYWANTQLKRVFDNEHISIGTLRHTYLIHNRPQNDDEREELANSMGHSVDMQKMYSFQ